MNNQSIFDIALQETGTIESLFEIAAANESKITSLSEPVTEGIMLTGEIIVNDKLVLDLFRASKYPVASGSKKFYRLTDTEDFILEDITEGTLVTKEY